MSEQGTSYGPAFSRVTRTPITFGPVPEDRAGQYTNPTDLSNLLSSLPIVKNFLNRTGNIRIDPESTSNVGRTIRHEDVHSLLHNLDLSKLNLENPSFLPALTSTPFQKLMGNPQRELPAYTATGESSQIGIPDPLSSAYLLHLQDQLFKIDPNLAKKFQQLRSK